MNSPFLNLPYLAPSQAQKHVTHNEALQILDDCVQLAALTLGSNTAPASPMPLDRHIVGTDPEGAWAGNARAIASFEDGEWRFLAPKPGWRAWITDPGALAVFHSGDWQIQSGVGTSTMLGVNTTPDTSNRLAVKSDAVLFSHDDQTPGTGDAVLSINRADSAKSAQIQFSTAYVTGAQVGFSEDTSFRVKVSADGASFKDAITVSPITGNVGFNTAPGSERLAIREDVNARTECSITNLDSGANAASTFRLNAANGHYFSFQLYGTGTVYAYTNARLILGTYADKPLILRTDTTDRMYIHGDGRISIGTSTASALLSVNGAIRHGQYTVSTLPDAAANGAGAMIYVSDASGGAIMAFSDGSSWRRVSDRTVVS
ncbi:DUF2793 domain-containing protein [Hoeflea sp. YIM 152468]|uniref:DUF2793 domain-containing protein n=1 Tax=Hoeflea sp. YIM 152468 TaxID=3031759 RepID=UPI0023DBD707|nr:DUF2793 domain-containing protein [Hoeflea sp. YIM 152468]MDF1610272.1 DUF2793 domain-containing protein [Hoeflea sp. YIM 152468]